MGSEIKFYVSIFLRRFHYFALVAAIVSAVAVVTALLMPSKFYTEAVLLVEPPQIPANLASSTFQTAPQQQLQIIQQRLLTRGNLIDIANENRVFANRGTIHPDDVADKMRKSTTFRINVGPLQASLVTIGFEDSQADTTAAVVNDYVTRVLEANSESRRGVAEDTKDYFDQEVARLSADLAAKNAEILEFNNKHVNALPQNLSGNMGRLSAAQQRIEAIDRQLVQLGQQRERTILVFNATGGTGTGGGQAMSPERQRLNALKSQFATAVTVYSEDSVRLKSLRVQIEKLEKIVADQAAADADDADDSTTFSMLDVQLDQIDSQIQDLKTERVQMEQEIARLQKVVDETPANQIIQDTLLRDYQNIQSLYNQAVSRAAVAATGERIELTSKGERIIVLNPPVVPREPSSPNRMMIAAGGVAAGLFLGLAVVVLLELLNRSIRRPVDLSRGLGIVPIATLPMMRTPGEIAWRRAVMAGVIMTSTVGIAAGIFFVHTQVMPLDLLVDKAVQQLGV